MSDTTALMTVYNTPAHYLRQAIESLLCQTVQPYIDVWLDGEDQHEQYELLSRYRRDIMIHVKPNTGLTDTLNQALCHIHTPFILRQDADDVSMPNRLEVLREFMLNNPRCGAVGDNYAHVDGEGQILRVNTADPQAVPPARYAKFGLAGTVAGGGVLLRTKAIVEVGGWKYKRAQDCYMWHALTAAGWSVNSVKETVYHWRHHREQISHHAQAEQHECVEAILKEFAPGTVKC